MIRLGGRPARLEEVLNIGEFENINLRNQLRLMFYRTAIVRMLQRNYQIGELRALENTLEFLLEELDQPYEDHLGFVPEHLYLVGSLYSRKFSLCRDTADLSCTIEYYEMAIELTRLNPESWPLDLPLELAMFLVERYHADGHIDNLDKAIKLNEDYRDTVGDRGLHVAVKLVCA